LLPDAEMHKILRQLVSTCYQRVTDGRTDRHVAYAYVALYMLGWHSRARQKRRSMTITSQHIQHCGTEKELYCFISIR